MAQLKLAALAALAVLAGCTGGGTSRALTPARTAPAASATVALSLLIPRAPSAAARSARYISAGTKSVVVTVNGGAPQGFDVYPGAPNCSTGANGTTCTMSVIAPIINGFDTLAIAAYDQPRAASGAGQGNVLSDGSIQIIVLEGTDNKVQLSLGGSVATLALNIPDPHPWYWVNRPIDGNLDAKDAAGYTIIGYYDAKITMTLTPMSGWWQNAPPIQSSYDGLHYLYFLGGPSGPVTVKVTAANGASASQLLTPVVESGTVAVTAPDRNITVDVPYNRTLPFNVVSTTTLYGAFDTPRASAFDASGNVYMTDNGTKSANAPAGPAVWMFQAGYCYGCIGATSPVVLGSTAFGGDKPLVVAADAPNNVLYVATATAIYRFALPLTASSVPAATISGPATGLAGITGIAVGANELAVSMSTPSLETFAKNASGNAAPQRTIAGAVTTLQTPGGLAYDASGNLWVADAAGNGVAVFAPAANGNTAPSSALAGSATALNAPQGVAFDRTGVIYVADHSGRTHLYAAGATGNSAPQGATSGATSANGIAVMP